MASTADGRTRTWEESVAATVLPYLAVKLTAGKAALAGAGEGASVVGFSGEIGGDDSLADGYVAITLRNAGGTVKATVAEAVAIGAKLYCAASGKLTDVVDGEVVAIALAAASANNSVIEVLPVQNGQETDSDPFDSLALGAAAITVAELAALPDLFQGMVAVDSYGNKYMLVKNDNVNGATVGKPLGIRSAGDSESDMTDDTAAADGIGSCRGAAASVFSGTNVFGWMFYEGSLETALNGAGMSLVTDGNVVAGMLLYWLSDGVFTGVALTSASVDLRFVGVAAADDSGTDLSKGFVNGRNVGVAGTTA